MAAFHQLSHPVNMAVDERQVENSAGGMAYQLSDADRLKRFLVLGSDQNSFYSTARELTLENAAVVSRLIEQGKGVEVVELATKISLQGRAPKQGPALFAIAMVAVLCRTNSFDEASKPKRKAHKAALESFVKVCRTASTLYELVLYYKLIGGLTSAAPVANKMIGFSSSMKKAVGDWFLCKTAMDVAKQVTKYPQRNGVGGRDLLRLAHPKAADLGKRKRAEEVEEMDLVLHYTTHPADQVEGEGEVAAFLRDAKKLKSSTKDVEEAVEIIQRHWGLGWEHIGETRLLKNPRLWAALLDQGMGLTALVRNLTRFVEIGLLKGEVASPVEDDMGGLTLLHPGYAASRMPAPADSNTPPAAAEPTSWQPDKDYMELVCNRLTDEEELKRGRMHPLKVLIASRMLERRQAGKVPVKLAKALDTAFEKAFAAVEPTGKRLLLAVDVSGSMWQPCCGAESLMAKEAAAAIALILTRKEPHTKVVAFSHELVDFPVAKDDNLEAVLNRANNIPFGATDCSLPMVYAREADLDVDAFIILTDNETWMGEHAAETLRQYRASRKLEEGRQPAKLMVGAFSATEFTIADPNDPGMLDIAGLDSALPEIMHDFLVGEI